jgi:hypothetical protein
MKKLILLTTLGVIAVSCKKSYNCQCTRVVNAETWNPMVTNTSIKDTKKNAESQCKSLSYSLGWQDYQSCQLK